MNQEIEYAEMLEIPVSTVNVVRKKRRKKNEKAVTSTPAQSAENTPLQTAVLPAPPLKDTVIAQVNERIGEEGERVETTIPAPENQPVYTPAEDIQNEGALRLDPVPERIDTVRLYAEDEMQDFTRNGYASIAQNLGEKQENPPTMYETKDKKPPKAVRIALGVEFACACALCGAIFLTNVFMPGSAINTFFKGMIGAQDTQTVNNRVYSDFELSPIVNDYSGVILNLSDTGVLSFTDECCVYPAADGEIEEVTKTEDGYTVKIRYSTTFTGVFNGLDQVFYAVGDKVKENVPVGFSDGETEVQVTMYSSGELLNCFRLTEENCLAWIDEE